MFRVWQIFLRYSHKSFVEAIKFVSSGFLLLFLWNCLDTVWKTTSTYFRVIQTSVLTTNRVWSVVKSISSQPQWINWVCSYSIKSDKGEILSSVGNVPTTFAIILKALQAASFLNSWSHPSGQESLHLCFIRRAHIQSSSRCLQLEVFWVPLLFLAHNYCIVSSFLTNAWFKTW